MVVLATPEEIVHEGGDVVGDSVCVQVALKEAVPILRIEADFDVVFSPAVAGEDFVQPVAKVCFCFKNEAANPLFGVARAVSQNLLRERIHAAAGFPRPDRAEDGNASEEAPRGDHKPLEVFCGDLFSGIVILSQNEEKFVPFPGVRKEGQSAGSDSLLCLEHKNVQAREQNETGNNSR